jgi:hypothetical protein
LRSERAIVLKNSPSHFWACLLTIFLSTWANADDTDAPTLNAISIDKVTVDVSEEPQTITVSVDASDESGINWEDRYDTDLTFQDSGGGFHYARGSNDNPGELQITIDNEDVGGEWEILLLDLADVHGNSTRIRNLSDYGLPDSIKIIGGKESDPPILNAISIDKVTVDVSEEPQTITVSVDASDESGINWEDRYDTDLTVQDSEGGFHYARGSNDNPGELQITIDNEDVGGEWEILWLDLVDVHGNSTKIRNLSDYGLPNYFYVLKTDEPTSDISISFTGLYETLGSNYKYEMLVTAENLAPEATSTLNLDISTSNLRVTSVNRENGSQACSLTSSNYDSTVSCTTSEIPANSSVIFRVSVTAGVTGSSWINLKLVGETPDISLRDNYIYLSSTVQEDADSDGDGTPDNIDAFPMDPTETTDTDGDGIGNNTDIDDDGDGTNDSEDAFPLDDTEALDTDGDGIGNNADIDDDGDGFSDASESANGSDPLDANSVPSVSEEETGGLPIWMIYLGAQMAEQNPEPPEEPVNDEPVDPPLLSKCSEDSFGRVDCDEVSQISLPYSSSGSQAISRLPRPEYFSFGTFTLNASADYRVAELVAEDQNARVTPQISNLIEGQEIVDGESVQFELRSPPTSGQQTRLRFYLRFEGAAGQACENCTFNLERVFTSN